MTKEQTEHLLEISYAFINKVSKAIELLERDVERVQEVIDAFFEGGCVFKPKNSVVNDTEHKQEILYQNNLSMHEIVSYHEEIGTKAQNILDLMAINKVKI